MPAKLNLDDFDLSAVPMPHGTAVGDEAFKKKASRAGQRIRLLPSQWASKFIKIKGGDTGTVLSMDFSERKYLLRPYDTASKKVLLMTSRQTEKSTTLGNKLLSNSAMRPMRTSLFATPSAMQTKVFSNARLADIIDISPLIKGLTHKSLVMNILEKEFSNRSKIYLRYAFLSADRIRGLSVNDIFVDEIQDMLWDLMPVIEEASSHHKERTFVYSGTPKTFDNTIENYWSKHSTQSEWVIPCERHGTPNRPDTWHWNVLGVKNLGKKGPICDKCGGAINPEHPMAQWVQMNPPRKDKPVEFEGFRICRLMVPWYWKPDKGKENPYESWENILLDYARYPTAQFMNEVMAMSYDSGQKPLSRAELLRICDDRYNMDEDEVAKLGKNHYLYAGIDWGCHDDQTRIMTARGLVYFKDLTDDDLVAQWDPSTRKVTYAKPLVRTVREWDQPLIHFKNKGVDLMVTHTHRMRVRSPSGEWVTEAAADTVCRSSATKFVGCVAWDGTEVDQFTLPGLPKSPGYQGSSDITYSMDDWLELLGYLITEGGLCYDGDRPSCLKMSQRRTVNPDTYQRIQACLDRMGVNFHSFPNENTGDVNWTIYGKQFWGWYRDNVGSAPEEKRVPREFMKLSRRQLQILFCAMMDGDGSWDDRTGCSGGAFYSTSKGLCEDFQELCVKLGLRCIVRLHKPAEGNRKDRWRALWQDGRDHTIASPASSERVPYKGKVYCCAVPTGYIVTERNGSISYQGNTGENAYTVMFVGGYVRGDANFQIVYAKRFEGHLVDPDPQMVEIERLIRKFRVRYVVADYGMGFHPNKKLTSVFGPKRIHQFQYAPRAPNKITYKAALHRYIVFRTPVMSDIISAIKAAKIRFPGWALFEQPFANDMLALRAEYSDTMRMIKYDKPRGITDDSFHALLYCIAASFFDVRRPDIMAPIQESTESAQMSASEDYARDEMEWFAAQDTAMPVE